MLIETVILCRRLPTLPVERSSKNDLFRSNCWTRVAKNSIMWSIFGLILVLIPLLDAQAIVAPYQVKTIKGKLRTIFVRDSPFQVAIRSNNPTIIGSIGSSKQICNGVIIRDKYVLTTASCVHFQDAQTKQR